MKILKQKICKNNYSKIYCKGMKKWKITYGCLERIEEIQQIINQCKEKKTDGVSLKFCIFDYNRGNVTLVVPFKVNAEKFCQTYIPKYGMDDICLQK